MVEAVDVDRRAWLTLAIGSVAAFLVALDTTIVALALPKIADEFDASQVAVLWIVTAYTIAVASLLLLGGRLADQFGRKRVFLVGIVLFALSSAAAGLAPGIELLIVARVFQAAGGALLTPASLALVLPAFPIERRSTAVSATAAAGGLAAAVGPTVGAVIIEFAGWRWAFLINVPVVAVAFVAAGRVFVESRDPEATSSFDRIGIPIANIGVALLILGIVQGESWGWRDARVVAAFGAAAVLLAVFVFRSLRHPEPLLDFDLFKIRSFSVGVLATMFFGVGFFSYAVLLPTFLVRGWGYSTLAAGLAIAPGSLLAAVVSPVAGRLSDQFGHRWVSFFGIPVGAVGLLWLIATVDADANYLGALLPATMLVGIGAGVGFSSAISGTMSQVPPNRFAQASAGHSTVFQTSLAIGVAIAVALLSASTGNDLVNGFRHTWWLSLGGFVATALTFALLFPDKRNP